MPRWLPDSFDPAAHNARVRSLRSAMREAEAASRVVHGNAAAHIDTSTAADSASARFAPGADQRGAPPRPSAATLLALPWPPSGNNAVRHAGGAHYLRPEVSQYRQHVAALCARAPRCMSRYVLHVHLSPPDARRTDADNRLKVLLDALVHAGVIPDDSMAYMRELHVTVDDARNSAAIVRVEPLDGPKRKA